MPMGDRWRRRHPRLIRDGDEYTVDELERGEVELEEREPRRDPPPEDRRGEHWGWTKGGDLPPDWNDYRDAPGYQDYNNPGPYDGSWEQPGGEARQ